MTPVNARYEFGQALFTGWAAASLCLLGGALLCRSCPRKTTSYPTQRPYPKPSPSSGKDYVWQNQKDKTVLEQPENGHWNTVIDIEIFDFWLLESELWYNQKNIIFLKYTLLKMMRSYFISFPQYGREAISTCITASHWVIISNVGRGRSLNIYRYVHIHVFSIKN